MQKELETEYRRSWGTGAGDLLWDAYSRADAEDSLAVLFLSSQWQQR